MQQLRHMPIDQFLKIHRQHLSMFFADVCTLLAAAAQVPFAGQQQLQLALTVMQIIH